MAISVQNNYIVPHEKYLGPIGVSSSTQNRPTTKSKQIKSHIQQSSQQSVVKLKLSIRKGEGCKDRGNSIKSQNRGKAVKTGLYDQISRSKKPPKLPNSLRIRVEDQIPQIDSLRGPPREPLRQKAKEPRSALR